MYIDKNTITLKNNNFLMNVYHFFKGKNAKRNKLSLNNTQIIAENVHFANNISVKIFKFNKKG